MARPYRAAMNSTTTPSSAPRNAAELLNLIEDAGGVLNVGNLARPERRAWPRAGYLLRLDAAESRALSWEA